MKVEYHTLHWNNVSVDMLASHYKVMSFFNIPVNYHNIDRINHGIWMNRVMTQATSDVVVFFEPDCIPLSIDYIKCVRYAGKNNTFVGIAQVSNHIPPKSHIYAAPGFYAISTKAYDELGRPSFAETYRSDVGEEICYLAEERGLKYQALLPTHFEKPSSEGVWRLGCISSYGIGTVFGGLVYHLYQSRMAENIELFTQRCQDVIDQRFTTSGMNSSFIF